MLTAKGPSDMLRLLALVAATCTFFLSVSAASVSVKRNNFGNGKGKSSSRPNFVYIISDDQDAYTANPKYMPQLSKHIAHHGSNYTNFFTPVSLCCPSRISFFRSQYAHNHNITFVGEPYGGWELFCHNGFNDKWLPTYLQDAGYFTAYNGKIGNGNDIDNYDTLPVTGFNRSNLLLDPFTYDYYNASISTDHQPPKWYSGIYSTDVLGDMSIEHIEEASKGDAPWFVGIAPVGPHTALVPKPDGSFTKLQPQPAKRFNGTFKDDKVPRTAGFNPDVPSGVSWVYNQPQRNMAEVDYLDEFWRSRVDTIYSVDDMVGKVMRKLEELDLLDNTYVIYTSDNGFANGQHRRWPGKSMNYEEDIRVPFFIRGPGIEKGAKEMGAWNVMDISTSILELAGGVWKDYDADGKLMPWAQKDDSPARLINDKSQHLSEYWVQANTSPGPFKDGPTRQDDSVYRTLRLVEKNQNWMYSVFCTGERELYDMTTDIEQMHNLLVDVNKEGSFAPLLASASIATRVATRLDALTLYLKTCRGQQCRDGWRAIFPQGDATTLKEALDTKFDGYFDRLPKLHYDNCELGYHLEREFPYWTTDLPYFQQENDTAVEPASSNARGKRDLLFGDWKARMIASGGIEELYDE